jgi:hypothetical protein
MTDEIEYTVGFTHLRSKHPYALLLGIDTSTNDGNHESVGLERQGVFHALYEPTLELELTKGAVGKTKWT